MALAKRNIKNETDLASKTPELQAQGNQKQIEMPLKTPKFEIFISPVEDGRKFEIEVVAGQERQSTRRQLLKDFNGNDSRPPTKKTTKVKAAPKKRSGRKSTAVTDEELKENKSPNAILNASQDLIAANNGAETTKKGETLPCRTKVKKLQSRVSLPEVKRKSLKVASPNKKKARRTLANVTNLESINEGEKVSPLSKTPEKAKKITRKAGAAAQTNVPDIEKLKKAFPNVDPVFLSSQLGEMKDGLEELIESLKKKEKLGELPLSESYKKKLENEKIAKKFMQDFTVKNFLKGIPDPWNYFLNTEIHNSITYANHSLYYLKNKHKKHYSQTIQEILARSDHSLYRADKELSNKRKNRMFKMRTTNRTKNECDTGKPDSINFQFLQEVLFIENEKEIIDEVKKIESAKSKKLKKAKTVGSLLRCQSCFRSDLLWEEAACCSGTHVFCGKCINRYVELEIGKGNFNFKCLLKCEEILSLESIQDVANPDLMAVIIRRNQLKEMRLAGIKNVEFCSYCYQIINTPSEQPTLSCLNPCCMREWCRYCKKPSHIPLECSEAEAGELSENLMETKPDCDFLICLNCKGEFIKEADSNKMICSCGIAICAICRQSFSDCPHFIPRLDEENSMVHDDLPYEASQEEPDSPKRQNSAVLPPPHLLPLSRDTPEFFPDFVPSESGTF